MATINPFHPDFIDKKALKILLNTYWQSSGWKNPPIININDFNYAKANGLMFDPVTISHQQIMRELQQLHQKININELTACFLASLSTRFLPWRSAIASYINSKICIENAEYALSYDHKPHCSCVFTNEDLSVLNVERFKWGGVRLHQTFYNWFDLNQFHLYPKPEPTEQDIFIFKQIIDCIENSPPKESPSKLIKSLKPLLNSNINELQNSLEIISCIGILPSRKYISGDYVFTGWRGIDGVNHDATHRLFGDYIK